MPRAGRRSPIPASRTPTTSSTRSATSRPGWWRTPRPCRSARATCISRTSAQPNTLIGSSEADVHVLPPVGPGPDRAGAHLQRRAAGHRGGAPRASSSTRPRRRSSRRRSTCATRATTGSTETSTTCRARSLGIGDIQIRRLKFTLFGTVQGRKFTRGADIVLAEGLDRRGRGVRPPRVRGRARPTRTRRRTATSCRSRRPSRCRSGDKGSTGEREKPPLQRDRHAEGREAGILGNGVTLPFEIGPNLPAFTTICTLAQSAAERMPARLQDGYRDRRRRRSSTSR